MNTTREEVKEQQLSNPPTTTTTTFVCLADRSCLKQAAHRCLQILFNSPFGSIPEAEFRERFRTMFQEELDFELVRNEMAPFIMVRTSVHLLQVHVVNFHFQNPHWLALGEGLQCPSPTSRPATTARE